jgi:predicted porin
MKTWVVASTRAFRWSTALPPTPGASSNANVFWLGRTVVALGSKTWGEVYLGREYSPAFWLSLGADPTYLSYVSQLGTPYSYANYTAVPAAVEASNIRWANTVGYKSPSFSGLTFELATALGEGGARGQQQLGQCAIQERPRLAGCGI